MTEKENIIEAILEIELQMFLTVNPTPTSSCQEYPASFKMHRRAQFAPWSQETLASYLDDLHAAQDSGKNLMRMKYTHMQDLIPRQSSNPLIDAIIRLKIDWQKEMFRSYPAVMSGARPLTDEGTQAQMTSFETYARGELETYSDRTLKLLHQNLLSLQERGENLSEMVYDYLVRASGYASIEEAERKLKARLESFRVDG